MNNKYIQYPLKRSLKPPAWECFSISIDGRILQCFGCAQIVLTLCHSGARFFKDYLTGSNKFYPLSTKFPLEPAEMSVYKYQAVSGLNNFLGELAQIAIIKLTLERSVTNVRCNTSVAWQKVAPKGSQRWKRRRSNVLNGLAIAATKFSVLFKLFIL